MNKATINGDTAVVEIRRVCSDYRDNDEDFFGPFSSVEEAEAWMGSLPYGGEPSPLDGDCRVEHRICTLSDLISSPTKYRNEQIELEFEVSNMEEGDDDIDFDAMEEDERMEFFTRRLIDIGVITDPTLEEASA